MDILVVGGGIGGLTAALALARDGHQVLVLEKAAQFAELGAGLQLAPNATRILPRLGVLDRVLDAGVRPRRLLLRSAVTAEELTALDLAQGACQAIEDAGALARALAGCPGGVGPYQIGRALAQYAATRVSHAARVQRTARTWGDIWHVSGVGALLRDELFRRRPADDYSYTDWLYGPVRPSAL